MWEDGCYADAAGEEEDGAVGRERGWYAVGAIDEGGEVEEAVWFAVCVFEGRVVEGVSEATFAANDETDCCWELGEGVSVDCGGVGL